MLFVISLIRAIAVKQHETNICVYIRMSRVQMPMDKLDGCMNGWMYGWSTSDGLHNSI